MNSSNSPALGAISSSNKDGARKNRVEITDASGKAHVWRF
jgi:hypothetical protein